MTQVSTPAQADDAIVERFAALSHEQWAGWTKWMFDKMHERHSSGEWFIDRWRRQIATPYRDLPEEQKESDRIEARKWLALLQEALR